MHRHHTNFGGSISSHLTPSFRGGGGGGSFVPESPMAHNMSEFSFAVNSSGGKDKNDILLRRNSSLNSSNRFSYSGENPLNGINKSMKTPKKKMAMPYASIKNSKGTKVNNLMRKTQPLKGKVLQSSP